MESSRFEVLRAIKRRTFWMSLLFLFIYLIVSVIVGASLIVVLSLFYNDYSHFWPEFIGATLVTFLFINGMTWLRANEMSGGTESVLKQFYAMRVDQLHSNALVRRYYQVAEEMCIAANIDLPKLYILPTYEINALAMAADRKDVAIAITEGALTRLTRGELKALVAHEVSHIYHDDCIINFRMISWLYGLQSVYLYGRDLSYHLTGIYSKKLDRLCLGYSPDFRMEKEAKPLTIFLYLSLGAAYLIMMLGVLGAVSARLVKSFIIRQREYLADAESVRLTRSKELASVLKKIAGLIPDEMSERFRAQSIYQEFIFLYLDNYSEHRKPSLFDTHPPILKRIHAIDPTYSPSVLERVSQFNGRNCAISTQFFPPESRAEEQALILYAKEMGAIKPASRRRVLGLTSTNERPIHALGSIYAIILSFAAKEQGSALDDYLKERLNRELYQQYRESFKNIISRVSIEGRVEYLIEQVAHTYQLADSDRQELLENLKKMIEFDKNITIFELLAYEYVRSAKPEHYESKVIRFGEKRETIQSSQKEIIQSVFIMLNIGFQNRLKNNLFQEIFSQIQSIPNPKMPQKRSTNSEAKELYQAIIHLKNLSIEGDQLLAQICDQLYHHRFINQEGRAFIHLYCMILNLPLPKELHLKLANKH